MNHWDKRFLELAHHVAQWSKDPSTKVGSVIVDHKRRVIGLGYNGFPREVHDHEHRYESRETKYKLVVHSEANAILNAITSVEGCTIYAARHPCSDCTKLIIQSGITRVVTDQSIPHEPWSDDLRFSTTMLSEAGVIVDFYDREKTEN